MKSRQRLTILLLILLVLSIVIGGVFTYVLYETAFEQQRERLRVTAKSQARLIKAVTRFDAINSQFDHPKGARAATLSQIIDAQKNDRSFGETGELTFAIREKNRIIFKLSQRRESLDNPASIPFDSKLAEPMRLALSGHSGTVIGLDYRGIVVLAAYEPVEELSLGIVAKINLLEIRAPFMKAGIISGSVSLAFIVVGIFFFFRISEPVVKDLEEKNVQLKKYKEIFSQTNDLAYIGDTTGNILMVNATFEKLTNHKPEEYLGKSFAPLFDDENLEKAISYYTKTLNGESPKFELRFKETSILCEYKNTPLRDERGTIIGVIGIARDITKRKQQEEQLLHHAHFDTLTDLPNRFLSLDRLSQLLKEAQRKNSLVALLYLDLDDFKKINDTLGHETGDKLLIEVADRLRSVARTSDTVGRLGGDEFIVLIDGLKHPSDARSVVQNMMNPFTNPFKVDANVLKITACVGISVFPRDGETPSKLLRCADSAMYHAKKLGHDTYSYFTDAMNREVSRRLALEGQMHGAMDRREFTLVYQPQIEVQSGRVFGAEALLRWHNPALKHIRPKEFIPLAEQTGLIVPLGKFVLDTALDMTARLRRSYDPEFHMAINLSPRQFREPDLSRFIEKKLDHYNIPGKCLELEITEGVLMSGETYIDDAISTLRNMGISISMDDFGTGYSSLSYLRTYSFDMLKIDQSFIRDIMIDSADQALVDASISMAHGLNLKVVAEGVETKAQLEYLKKRGCDTAQGYFFAKPMTGDDLFEWLLNKD